MKMIFIIAKTELRNLFYSPVAWFLAVVFMVQGAVYFTDRLYQVTKEQEALIAGNPHFNLIHQPGGMTGWIFVGSGFFENILQNLYLFVPLLTMGIISREINNGTNKLLYSSAVKLREIVLGKYLAIMCYNLLLLSVLGVFMLTGLVTIPHLDYGLLFSATLGFYLLVCAYTAIGLFMSSLTIYEIIAAISSFTVIFILSLIGTLWQKYDFVRDLTYFLSIKGRTHNMLKGLITTKDVFYFLIIVGMFISFTLFRLKGGRESRPWYVKFSRYVLVFVGVLVLGYTSSRPGLIGYWDMSATKTNTIDPKTQKVIKQLGDQLLDVTLYVNLLSDHLEFVLPEQRNNYLSLLWEPYVRFKPGIRFHYIYYYDINERDSDFFKRYPGKTLDQIAKQIAHDNDLDLSLFMPRESIRKIINLAPEDYRQVMQLRFKGRTTFLRTFGGTFFPGQAQVSAALSRLVCAKLPMDIYTTGNLERSIYKTGEREYSDYSITKRNNESLINLGFDSDTLSLELHDIPPGTTTLVLADPKTALSPVIMTKLKQYVDHGGNMLIAGEPGKQQILNPLLKSLGVQLMNGELVEISKDQTPDFIKPYLTPEAYDLAQEPKLLGMKKFYQFWKKDSLNQQRDTDYKSMIGATGVIYHQGGPFKVRPLLLTTKDKDWIKTGKFVIDSVPPVFNPASGDSKLRSYTTMVALTRQMGSRQQRIVVAGDADFLSNGNSGAEELGRGIFSWLDNNQFPIYATETDLPDNIINMSSRTAKLLTIAYVWAIPGLLLLLGVIILIRRKRS